MSEEKILNVLADDSTEPYDCRVLRLSQVISGDMLGSHPVQDRKNRKVINV